MLPKHFRYRTHCTVTGGAQYGKSKTLELFARAIIKTPPIGLNLLDPHGNLHDALMPYLAYMKPKRRVVSFNFTDPDHIQPLRIFELPEGWELTAHVNHTTDAILRTWNTENSDLMPTFARLIRMILTVVALSGEPIHHVAKLLEFPKKELREWAISLLEGDDYTRQQWKQLQYVRDYEKWLRMVESTQNRLGRLIGSTSVRLFTGLRDNALSIPDLVKERAIVLWNLRPSGRFSAEASRTITSLVLSQLFQAALENIPKPVPHLVMVDEAASVLDSHAAAMLDQILKSGMRMTLAFHHLDQFNDRPHLKSSLAMHAQINYFFGGQQVHEAKRLVEQFLLADVNRRMKKDDRFQFVTDHEEESYEEENESSNSYHGVVGDTESSGGGQSKSRTHKTRFRPVLRKELMGQEDWTREEKISMYAEQIVSLGKRECFTHLPNRVLKQKVPAVEPYLPRPARLVQFMKALRKTSTPYHEAEERQKQEERTFLERSRNYAGHGRPKKKPAHLHPQE